jgi:hypothetical protein
MSGTSSSTVLVPITQVLMCVNGLCIEHTKAVWKYIMIVMNTYVYNVYKELIH